MTKKAYWNWSVWISLIAGIYITIYLSSPLAKYGVIWATFIALPIFFTGGGQWKEWPNYLACNLAGIVWGIIDIFIVDLIAPYVGVAAANGIACFIVTTFLCFFAFVPCEKTWLNKPACMFGSFAAVFAVGSPLNGGCSWAKIGVLAFTMMCGPTLVIIMNNGLKLLDEKGSWKFRKTAVK